MADRLAADLELTLGALSLAFRLRSAARAVALVGPSGAGKSTALRIVAGVERRARGTLAFDGQPWQAPGLFLAPHRRGVGWVPQDGRLFPHLSVRGNLAYARPTHAALAETADRLGISHLLDRAPRHLSGGERQRVALGRALLAGPRLLLLDEPFAALDDALRSRLSADIAALCRERGLPFLVVSHHPADVAALAEEVWEVDAGRFLRM